MDKGLFHFNSHHVPKKAVHVVNPPKGVLFCVFVFSMMIRAASQELGGGWEVVKTFLKILASILGPLKYFA